MRRLWALDTNVLLYALTRGGEFHDAAARLLKGEGGAELGASQLVIAELLSHASVKTASEYAKVDGLIRSGVVELWPVTAEVLYRAADLRREQRLTLADAIHVAGAVMAGAKRFVTNDRDLLRLELPGLEVVALAVVGVYSA